jgi:flagella basal body P-ring formation protein FlgA
MSRTLLAAMLVMETSTALSRPASQTVSAGRIVAAARAQLDQRLGSERDAAQIAVVGQPEDVVAPLGAVALKAHALSGRWPRARVGVPVDVSVNGRIMRSATVWFALTVHEHSLSYGTDVPLGASAGSIKWISQEVDVADMQGQLVKDPHDIEGMRLRHPVLAGAVVVREDFEQTPDVDRQQRVEVRLAIGAIHMQTKGTAEAKGDTGDVIPVLVDAAEAPVRARITDKGVVEVVQ